MSKLAIFALSNNGISETFIRDHVTYLHDSSISFYGKGFDLKYSDGTYAIPKLKRAIANALRVYSAKIAYRYWIFETSKLLIKHKVTHILAEYGVTGSYLYKVASRAGIRLVVHFHGYDAFHSSVLLYYADFYKEMFCCADAIIVVSCSMQEHLINNLGAPREKVHNIACGVSPEKLEVYRQVPKKPHSFVFLGRFVDKKAPDEALLAFARVKSKHPDSNLTLIGEGPLLPVCKRLAKALGISDSVTFMGALPSAQALSELAQHQIYLQTSIVADSGDREGTPVALIEAQMLGLPCVGTWHEGIKEVVQDGKTGLLVNEHDIDELANAMLTLLTQVDLMHRMSLLAQEGSRKNYSQNLQLAKLRAVIFNR